MKYAYFYVLIIAILVSVPVFSGCLGFGEDSTNNQVTVGDASPTTGTSSSSSSDNKSPASSSVDDTYEPYHADKEDWYTPGSESSSDEDESEDDSEDEETESEKGERIPVLVYSANQDGLFDNSNVVFLQLKKTRTFPRSEVEIKEGDVIRLRNMDDVHRTVFRVHSAEGFFKDRDLWRNYDMFIQFNKKGTYTLELYNGAEEEGKLTAFSGDKPSTLTVTVK